MEEIASSLDVIQNIVGLSTSEIAELSKVTEATALQWARGTSRPQRPTEERLSHLASVARRLDAYYTQDEIRQWLNSPHPQLERKRAIDLIQAGKVTDVSRVLNRLDSDGYI